MGKFHPPYSAEFRQQIVELAKAGRSPSDLAREFGCIATSIQNWINRDRGRGPSSSATLPLTLSEREELQRLRREVKQLKVERDILERLRPSLP